MKEKKIRKELFKRIKWIKNDRDNLLARNDLQPYQMEDLRDFNEAIMHLAYVYNYYSVPSKHLDALGNSPADLSKE